MSKTCGSVPLSHDGLPPDSIHPRLNQKEAQHFNLLPLPGPGRISKNIQLCCPRRLFLPLSFHPCWHSFIPHQTWQPHSTVLLYLSASTSFFDCQKPNSHQRSAGLPWQSSFTQPSTKLLSEVVGLIWVLNLSSVFYVWWPPLCIYQVLKSSHVNAGLCNLYLHVLRQLAISLEENQTLPYALLRMTCCSSR